ncbi:MAG: serine/threonine-protein kinase [Polyangiaceae bacterium]
MTNVEKVCATCGGTAVRDDGLCPDCGERSFDPLVGHVLDGKYRVDSLLGAGGMGKVYVGTHLALGERVAIKFLHRIYGELPTLRARFRREAELLAKIRHPGVVSVLDFGDLDGELYLVMELVKGTPLSNVLSKNAPALPLPRIGEVFDQLLQVLVAVHEGGVVHRDLKPDNVMLVERSGRFDHIKLLDFGLARIPQSGEKTRLTEVGSVQGTPHYMSPEQCRGEDVGPETDVYAVGCMLYESITGVPPFDAEESAGLLAQHMFVEPPAMDTVGHKRTDISVGLQKVVRRALSKSPAARYSALEFRDALAAALQGTDPDSMLERAADERVRVAALDREDRAPTQVKQEKAPTEDASLEAATVVIWVSKSHGASEIRTALSVAGFRATLWEDATDPPLVYRDEPIRAFVVSFADEGQKRLVRLRELSKGTLVLCVGAKGAREITDLIRAGATDATIEGAANDEISRRVKRMLRRGR